MGRASDGAASSARHRELDSRLETSGILFRADEGWRTEASTLHQERHGIAGVSSMTRTEALDEAPVLFAVDPARGEDFSMMAEYQVLPNGKVKLLSVGRLIEAEYRRIEAEIVE